MKYKILPYDRFAFCAFRTFACLFVAGHLGGLHGWLRITSRRLVITDPFCSWASLSTPVN